MKVVSGEVQKKFDELAEKEFTDEEKSRFEAEDKVHEDICPC